MAKNKRTTNFDYKPTKDDLDAMSYCNDRDCKVVPLSVDSFGNTIRLKVERVGKSPVVSPDTYDGTKVEWIKAVFRIYNHYKKIL